MTHGFISNFAVVGLFLTVWLLAKEALQGRPRWQRAALFGLLVGTGAIGTMAMAVELADGIIFDLRIALVASAALLEGPMAGLIAAAMAAAFRLSEGGDGAIAGAVAIAIATAVGIAGYRYAAALTNRRDQIGLVAASALAASLLPDLAILLLPHYVDISALGPTLLFQAWLNFVAIFATAVVVRYHDRRLTERALLFAAIRQAPDYFYVKNRQSRFVAVNEAVASHNGFASPSQMIGKTDLDLDPGRASALLSAEEEIMAGKQARAGIQETVRTRSGRDRVFDSAKVPVADVDGHVIGLVGITRDITENWESARQLAESHQLLFSVLSKMTDGVALFDEQQRLVYCNEQYHAFFSMTRDVRVTGARLQAILRVAAERGEQPNIPNNNIDSWIGKVVAGMAKGDEEEIQLFDGRTVHVRTRVVPGLGTVSVASDITRMRRAERELAALVARMEAMAMTDGLTGIMNRRALDQQLEREMARARRSRKPLGIVLIDVDRFKRFNDIYGHPEGDSCLCKVAEILKAGARRPGDIVARYGGEEFCVVLPDTDECAAEKVANAMRKAVEDAGIAHTGNEPGVVTISAGVAEHRPDERHLAKAALLERADAALYSAKESGRNRVVRHGEDDAGAAARIA